MQQPLLKVLALPIDPGSASYARSEPSTHFCFTLKRLRPRQGAHDGPCVKNSDTLTDFFTVYYVKNHCLFLDFMILIATVEVVLWGKGAR